MPSRSKSAIIDSSDSSYKIKSDSLSSSSSISKEDHIYSQDPLIKQNNESANLYECIDYEIIDQKMKSNENIV